MTEQQPKQQTIVARLFLKLSPSLKYWGFRVASWLSRVVPLKISYGISVAIGDFIYYTWHEHSGNAVSNMRRVLGPGTTLRQAKAAARESFRNYAKTLLDFIRFQHVTQEEVQERVETSGWELVDAALAEGKGALALSGHIGNWDFAGAVLGRRDIVMHAIADKLEPPEIDEMVRSTRERNGVHILPLGPAALRSMLLALKRNEMVLLLMDRPMGPDDGIAVRFFGETAYLPSGPAAIALKSGAALITGALPRLPGDMHFRGMWETIPYKHLLTGDKDADIAAVTQQIATALEHVIARNPDQWYMFRPMWPRADISRKAARREAAELREIAAANGQGRLLRLLRLRRRRGRMDVAALGISVDPPDMESWARGEYNEHPQAQSDAQAHEGLLPWPRQVAANGHNGSDPDAAAPDQAAPEDRRIAT